MRHCCYYSLHIADYYTHNVWTAILSSLFQVPFFELSNLLDKKGKKWLMGDLQRHGQWNENSLLPPCDSNKGSSFKFSEGY